MAYRIPEPHDVASLKVLKKQLDDLSDGIEQVIVSMREMKLEKIPVTNHKDMLTGLKFIGGFVEAARRGYRQALVETGKLSAAYVPQIDEPEKPKKKVRK